MFPKWRVVCIFVIFFALQIAFNSFMGFKPFNIYTVSSQFFDSCWSPVSVSAVVKGQLQQDDASLIRYIQDHVLLPPDTRPYNLTNSTAHKFSWDGIEKVLDFLFDGKKHGTFFEAGAYNGEDYSNTLYLEKQHSWKGLLVEASPDNQKEILNRHRKAWLARACISATDQPNKISFVEAGAYGYVDGYSDDLHKNAYKCGVFITWNVPDDYYIEGPDGSNCTLLTTKDTSVQCFPLYSLLLAAGMVSIDFMSLDIQGMEIHALRTLPFDKLDIKVILVETFEKQENVEVEELMRSKGYVRLTDAQHRYKDVQMLMDVLYIKRGLAIPIR